MQAIDAIKRLLPPLTASEIERALASVDELPTLPVVVERILALSARPDTQVRELSAVIGNDPAITAKVLKVANSPFYSPVCEIKTLENAIMMIGFEEVRHFCAAAKLVDAFPAFGDGLTLTVEDFWRHALACGMISRFLAGKLGFANPEEFFFAGLLHDFGKMVIYQCFPRHFVVISALAAQNRLPFYAIEQELLGFDHAHFGGIVAGRWRLPQLIAEVIAGHHNVPPANAGPASAGVPWGRECAVVHLSDYLAHLLFSPPVMCLLSDNIWKHLPTTFQADMKDFWGRQEAFRQSVLSFF